MWSMTRADHCNHACQLPYSPSSYNSSASYLDILWAVDEDSIVEIWFIPNNANANVTSSDQSTNPNDFNSPTKKYVFNEYVQEMSHGLESTDQQRQLRTYSDSNEWNPLSSNKLTSLDGIANENFGSSVSISGDYLAVGAIGTKDFQGRLFIYQRLGVTIWRQEYFALLGDSDYTNDFFGWSSSLSGDAVAVGAYQTMHVQEDKRNSVGGVYIYLRVSFCFLF
jgi:hypothetical protein